MKARKKTKMYLNKQYFFYLLFAASRVCSLPVGRGCGSKCIWRVEDKESDICILVTLVVTSKGTAFLIRLVFLS
jgi:hypothetical protein